MQEQFYNQPVVDWARQTLTELVPIKLRFASRWARTIVYLLLFSIPALIVLAMIFLKLTGGTEGSWLGIFLCAGVMAVPAIVIILVGSLTKQKFVKSLDASGVMSSMGKIFLWENLYYIDHVSKVVRTGNVRRKIEDNQLELVFADGKAIIPPLIYEREQMWSLVNSIPAQVRWDGEVKGAPPQQPGAAVNNFDDFLKAVDQMTAQPNQSKQQ